MYINIFSDSHFFNDLAERYQKIEVNEKLKNVSFNNLKPERYQKIEVNEKLKNVSFNNLKPEEVIKMNEMNQKIGESVMRATEVGMKLVHLDAFDVEIDSEQFRKDKLAELRSKIFVDLCLTPKKIILHDPATIILWIDGTKTVVKRDPVYDSFDPEKGIALCFMKKALGNHGKFNDILKKGIEDNKKVKTAMAVDDIAEFESKKGNEDNGKENH